jgi:hypothetical protein
MRTEYSNLDSQSSNKFLKRSYTMSKKIMQENLEQCLQMSEQELESVVGGVLVNPTGRPGRPSAPPLPRPGGGIAAAAAEEAATIAAIVAGLAF